VSWISISPVIQFIFGLNSCKNGIPKTALSLPNSRILNNTTTFYPLISILTSPVLRWIISFLYNIRSPEIMTNRYGFSFCLWGNPIFLIVAGDMWFFIAPLFINALNFWSCHLAHRLRCLPMTLLRVWGSTTGSFWSYGFCLFLTDWLLTNTFCWFFLGHAIGNSSLCIPTNVIYSDILLL